MLFVFKPCIQALCCYLLCVFFLFPTVPLELFFHLGPFQCFRQWDCTIQMEGVFGTMVYCGHYLVCINEHPPPFICGFLIGPIVLSSRHGCHKFLSSLSFLLLFQSYFSWCISNWELIIRIIAKRIERRWCILMLLFGVY
jgi:hypothetical protein